MNCELASFDIIGKLLCGSDTRITARENRRYHREFRVKTTIRYISCARKMTVITSDSLRPLCEAPKLWLHIGEHKTIETHDDE